MKIIDVSHTIHDGMITYKGLPPPIISDHLSREDARKRYEAGTEFQIGKIEMVANTGTYLDSPFHRYPDGIDLAGLELESVANLATVVVRLTDHPRAIDDSVFENLELNDKALLIHTGWDRYWRKEEYSSGNHPFLTAAAADLLVAAKVTLVGIDSFNIDDTAGGQRPVHSKLLAHGIPIVEHLCGLGELPDNGFRFFAVPVKVKGMGSFPVRAFAIVGD
jgi:kynurenine formamidase